MKYQGLPWQKHVEVLFVIVKVDEKHLHGISRRFKNEKEKRAEKMECVNERG